ncbi:MAG: tetrahydrofolate dehydrogenase/cyclohydrolase catalytic domain-containing protein [Syntrophomonadaceae bacterium]|jgi:methylenetetrahydrofolate dehydrogenase (NADP+)/methenyltetrahydrofolate cyclohydrolase
MQIISGAQIAAEIKAQLYRENQALGLCPTLAVILVGADQDSQVYVELKQKAAASIGGHCQVIGLAADISVSALFAEIKRLNDDEQVHGIILQLPLPPGLQTRQDDFLAAIRPDKDVDGFNPLNRGLLIGGRPLFTSCAALACLEVVNRYISDLPGRRAVLIGDSFDLVLPLAAMLVEQGCEVEIRPVWTANGPIKADVLVAEKGGPDMIGAAELTAGMLVIDAGFYWEKNGVKGNVNKEEVAKLMGTLLPVPGGMGPVLIAKLMQNLSRAARSVKA